MNQVFKNTFLSIGIIALTNTLSTHTSYLELTKQKVFNAFETITDYPMISPGLTLSMAFTHNFFSTNSFSSKCAYGLGGILIVKSGLDIARIATDTFNFTPTSSLFYDQPLSSVVCKNFIAENLMRTLYITKSFSNSIVPLSSAGAGLALYYREEKTPYQNLLIDGLYYGSSQLLLQTLWKMLKTSETVSKIDYLILTGSLGGLGVGLKWKYTIWKKDQEKKYAEETKKYTEAQQVKVQSNLKKVHAELLRNSQCRLRARSNLERVHTELLNSRDFRLLKMYINSAQNRLFLSIRNNSAEENIRAIRKELQYELRRMHFFFPYYKLPLQRNRGR